ncbi:MAG: AMP-binding protein [Armatimonadetes bacterium]|nr:AMP-binding protein [Armatimonadota bacterium]
MERNDEKQERVLAVVRQLAAELGAPDPESIRLSSHLEWDAGVGSVERHELLSRLERTLGYRVPSQGLFQAATVSDLVALLHPAEPPESGAPTMAAPTGGQAPPPPAHALDLVDALRYQAERQPDREVLFLLEEGRETSRLSFPQLVSSAGAVAGGLVELGVVPGERVGIMLPTEIGFLSAFFGCLWAGAVAVPLYPPFRLDQVEDYVLRQASILNLAGIRHLISFPRARAIVPLLRMTAPCLEKVMTVEELRGEPPPPRPHRLALIQFTSGSTGLPKGVTLTQENLLANIRAYGQALELEQGDVTVSWLPLYHDMGLIGTLLGSIYHGQPLALMPPQDFLARPSRWLAAVHRYRGTISAAPNFAYEICARKIPDEELEGVDLSCWRVALNGAEAVRADTLQRFAERFAACGFDRTALFPAYGLAEASLAVTFPPVGRGPVVESIARERLERDGTALPVETAGLDEGVLAVVSCGRPLPGMEVRIVGSRGRALDERRQGLIEFRGPSAMEAYYGNPEATRQAIGEDGWIHTGDLGYLADGELYVTGRRKDIILKAGRNLHPEDIEAAVAEVEGVRRGCVAAFGVPRAEQGTEDLVVVAESRSPNAELERAVAQQVTRSVGIPPDRVLMVSPHTVPKTPSGKIRRAECRERLLRGQLGKPASPTAQVVRLIVRRAGASGRQLLGWPRQATRALWCGTWLAAGLAAPQLVSLFDPGTAVRMLGPVSRLYLRMAGVRLEVRGKPFAGACVLVSNHASTLDPVVLIAVWPQVPRFLVAPWVAAHPALRQLISRLGHLPVHRGAPELLAAQRREMARILQSGCSLGVFPEGGVEAAPGLRPFALGGFQVAVEAGAPVVPVAIQGSRTAQPWPRLLPRPATITVHIGQPLWPEGNQWRDVVRLARSTREWIAGACGEPAAGKRLRRED